MSNSFSAVIGLLLVASVALNGHQCTRIGEVEERERGKDAAIAQLKKEPEWIGKVLAGLNNDKTEIDLREEKRRQETKKEFRNNPETKSWGDTLVPDRVRPGGGLLGKTRSGGNQAGPSGSVDAGTAVPGMDRGNKR